MQAVIYTRVSTQRQSEDGVSLDAQLERARAWCLAMGYEVVGEFEDAGISGARSDNRPGLQDAMAAACKNKAPLVVYSLSRLTRSVKECFDMADKLGKAGADLVSLSESIDTTTAAGKMLFAMLAAFAQFERDLTSERTKAALGFKKSQGYRVGSVPFGYDVEPDGKLVENKVEQDTLDLIFNLNAMSWSLRHICDELNDRGIPAKKGGKWHPKVVRGLIK